MTVDGAGLGRVIVLIPEILVINDASTDATSGLARRPGPRYWILPTIGAAMRAGYRFADAQRYDIAVRVDADGQHNARDIPLLLAGLREGEDLVIGSRFSGEPGTRSDSADDGRRAACRPRSPG